MYQVILLLNIKKFSSLPFSKTVNVRAAWGLFSNHAKINCFVNSESHSVMSYSLPPMDCSPTGYSVHEILQARILEWVAIPFSRGSSQLRDRTLVSCIAGRFFTVWVIREAPIYIIQYTYNVYIIYNTHIMYVLYITHICIIYTTYIMCVLYIHTYYVHTYNTYILYTYIHT